MGISTACRPAERLLKTINPPYGVILVTLAYGLGQDRVALPA